MVQVGRMGGIRVKAQSVQNEDGQALIWLILFLTVLLVFIALAIDVGNLHVHRLQTQSAADAGSLVGVRDMGSGDDAHYAAGDPIQRNGTEDVVVAGDHEEGAVGVKAVEDFPMFIAGLLDLDELTTGAVTETQAGLDGSENLVSKPVP